ncbi:MAG: spore germination protein [Coprococcus sp.]|nr:spore germination protein [Coprococcus sp.]
MENKTCISKNITENVTKVKTIFEGCNDLVEHEFKLNRNKNGEFSEEKSIYVVYIDGLCNNEMVESTIIKPVTWEWKENVNCNLWDAITAYEGQSADIVEENDFEKVMFSVLKGDTAIFVSDADKALVLSSKKLPVRGIEESSTEGGLRGPRDSFNESIRTSTALIRRRIKDLRLKVNQGTIGERSRTDYAIMYIEDLASKELVNEVKRRIDEYEIDAIFDSGMAEHLMEKKWYRPFPIFQSTTRPDKAAAAIVDGRVVIAFDNSPEVLIAPATINTLFQTSDDYYNRWPAATFARMIRYIAAFIAVGLPGFYIALTCYHREVIPDKLLYAIADARSQLSFPIVLEVLIMELLFELLREAGIRLPSQMGNTIGVVGGLIVGQSAVEAGIVSTMVVIVVALTAIASFAIPNEVFGSVFRLLKFFTIIAAAFWGLYGFLLTMLALVYVLASVNSFGVPYMSPAVTCGYEEVEGNRDFILREPISKLRFRPGWSQPEERRRLKRK